MGSGAVMRPDSFVEEYPAQ